MRGGDWDGERIPPAFWAQSRALTFRGKKGQDFLARLEAALVAWPSKKLAYEELAPMRWTDDDEQEFVGEACAIGVLAINSGVAPDAIPHEDEGMYDTCTLGQKLGATWVMAWTVAQANDANRRETPAERYERVLRWVRACREKREYVSANN